MNLGIEVLASPPKAGETQFSLGGRVGDREAIRVYTIHNSLDVGMVSVGSLRIKNKNLFVEDLINKSLISNKGDPASQSSA